MDDSDSQSNDLLSQLTKLRVVDIRKLLTWYGLSTAGVRSQLVLRLEKVILDKEGEATDLCSILTHRSLLPNTNQIPTERKKLPCRRNLYSDMETANSSDSECRTPEVFKDCTKFCTSYPIGSQFHSEVEVKTDHVILEHCSTVYNPLRIFAIPSEIRKPVKESAEKVEVVDYSRKTELYDTREDNLHQRKMKILSSSFRLRLRVRGSLEIAVTKLFHMQTESEPTQT